MSKIDESQIRDRLEALSQAKPSQEAADRATRKVRDALAAEQTRGAVRRPPSFWSLVKLTAAAVLMIGLGYLGGRLSAPAPLDGKQLRADIESSVRASLEQAIRQDLLKEMDNRWDSALAARSGELQDEFRRQLRSGLMEFGAQTSAYVDSRMDQRLAELVQQIHAARVQDRQRTAEALQYLESHRLYDRSQFGSGLVTLAARTDKLLNPQ